MPRDVIMHYFIILGSWWLVADTIVIPLILYLQQHFICVVTHLIGQPFFIFNIFWQTYRKQAISCVTLNLSIVRVAGHVMGHLQWHLSVALLTKIPKNQRDISLSYSLRNQNKICFTSIIFCLSLKLTTKKETNPGPF